MQMRTLPILMYHSISWHATPRFLNFAVSPREFAEQMRYLAANGYTSLTISALAEAMRNGVAIPDRSVALSFDDGFADFSIHALPELSACGLTGTVYLPSKYIGNTSRWLRWEQETRRPLLTWEQVAEAAAAGIEFGSHSDTHQHLDLLPDQDVLHEITRSKYEIEAHLGHRVTTFAYPYGHHTRRTMSIVRQAGITTACIVGNHYCTAEDNLLALPRMVITRETTLSEFAKIVCMSMPVRSRNHERLRAVVWRSVRRAKRATPFPRNAPISEEDR